MLQSIAANYIQRRQIHEAISGNAQRATCLGFCGHAVVHGARITALHTAYTQGNDEAVQLGSREIATGNHDLSNRTEQQVAASTGKQSQELDLINQAVASLDRMTQQNAAMVEESATAASSLSP